MTAQIPETLNLDGELYLVGLVGRTRLLGCDPLHASWYTGTLRVPRGEMLHYVHMGFGSVYEEEILIEVEKGCVVGERSVDNRPKGCLVAGRCHSVKRYPR
jgi:hypothetical protein